LGRAINAQCPATGIGALNIPIEAELRAACLNISKDTLNFLLK
jgi:hypothetical protein